MLRMMNVPARAEAIRHLLRSAPLRGSGCTVKTIHNHERCCRAPMSSSHNCSTATSGTIPASENGPSAWGLGRCTNWGRFYGHAKGSVPVASHVRSGDLGAKVQPLHDRSNRRDDWHALLPRYLRCDAGPFFWRPRRLGSLVCPQEIGAFKRT
jgi:hypothetical protein